MMRGENTDQTFSKTEVAGYGGQLVLEMEMQEESQLIPWFFTLLSRQMETSLTEVGNTKEDQILLWGWEHVG